MKIVIAGAGEVGSHLAKMLSNENHDITVIDPDEERLRQVDSSLDILSITGSATSFQVLKDAQIHKTDLYIAVAHHEDTNISSAILGKTLGAKKTIARIDNQEYLQPQNRDNFINLGMSVFSRPSPSSKMSMLSS